MEHVADSVELSGEPLFEARPWGSWRVLDQGVGYKVKRIRVTPGCRLSYQSHLYRSEHWVVISGAATCVIDGVESYAEVGTAVDVPCGAKHRLANGGVRLGARDRESGRRAGAVVACDVDARPLPAAVDAHEPVH